MDIDGKPLFSSDDRKLIDFLEYCIISRQLEPVFVFLVEQYHLNPDARRALALYDVFCKPGSPARIKTDTSLPPRNLNLQQAVDKIRITQDRLEQARIAAIEDPDNHVPPAYIALPMKNLFDAVVTSIRLASSDPLGTVVSHYDETLSPTENLPGGQMSQAQRQFVEIVWQPQARPLLVSAGFRRIANIA